MISGCSGGRKSGLLAELQARGHRVVEEPGHRIIAEETAAERNALPWRDLATSLRRAIGNAIADHAAAAATRDGRMFSITAWLMRQRSHRATKLTVGEAGGIRRASH